MGNIGRQFEHLRDSGKKGFIPFVTAGDPDLDTSLEIVLKLVELGADVIELGVPFSDPMADGPVIQRSSQRALANGTNLIGVLELAAAVRQRSAVPLVLFSYLNPILQFGLETFRDQAAKAGIDGLLITDIVDDEAVKLSTFIGESGIDLISLIAPTTTDERLQKICENARGFVYAVSRAGVTGARADTSSEAENLVRRAHRFSDLPIAVGFGISTSDQIENVWKYADAAVVGSAIVAEIERSNSPEEVVPNVEKFIRILLPQFAKNGIEN